MNASTKPILFLDVDGVLNHPGCYHNFHKAMEGLSVEEARRHYHEDKYVELLFAEECIAVLNSITDTAGAEIVLSSSWRMLYWEKRERFNALAKRIGIKAPVVDFTPYRGQGGRQRGDEIVSWLKANRQKVPIVVLDDDDDMNAVQQWFVQTDGAKGLTPADGKTALRKLKTRPWGHARDLRSRRAVR